MTQRLGRAAPVIPVADMVVSLAFYRQGFGLEVTFENGDPVTYAVLKKDAAEVHLSACSDPSPRSQNVMHLLVTDADAAAASCVAAGGELVEEVRDAPWGMRTFVVRDPDGHRIDVGQPLGGR